MKVALPVAILFFGAVVRGYSQEDLNTALVKRFYQEVYRDWNMDMVDEVLSADFVSHDWPGDRTGPEAFKAYYETLRHAIPDARYEVEDMIAQGDKVVVRWRMLGTHEGDFPGIEVKPTGRKINLNGIAIYRLEHGKLLERWVVSDVYGLLQELKKSAPGY